MIHTMYFDLGNVLIFFSHEKMYKQLETLSGLSVAQIQSILLKDQIAYQYETGKMNTEELYNHFSALSKKTFSIKEFTQAASDIFVPNTDLFPFVEQMKKKQIRLILLSNTSECHFNYIREAYPIIHLFDEWVLSYKVGACKPNPLIFQKALSLAQCPVSNCFFTDDIPEYVQAARKEGLDSEVFSGVSAFKEHMKDRGLNF